MAELLLSPGQHQPESENSLDKLRVGCPKLVVHVLPTNERAVLSLAPALRNVRRVSIHLLWGHWLASIRISYNTDCWPVRLSSLHSSSVLKYMRAIDANLNLA